MTGFIPKLVCFSCKFGWGYLNSTGYAGRLQNLIPVVCGGSVNASDIVGAFRNGADGVLVLGCPEGECHFRNGNYQARKRILLLQRTLKEFGIEPDRLKIRLNIDPEGSGISSMIDEMNVEIAKLGPLSPKV